MEFAGNEKYRISLDTLGVSLSDLYSYHRCTKMRSNRINFGLLVVCSMTDKILATPTKFVIEMQPDLLRDNKE